MRENMSQTYLTSKGVSDMEGELEQLRVELRAKFNDPSTQLQHEEGTREWFENSGEKFCSTRDCQIS